MAITIDKSFELPVYSPVCTLCRHLSDLAQRRCAAFDGEIPAPIWKGDNDHTLPYRGDHDIQFDLFLPAMGAGKKVNDEAATNAN